MRPPRLLIVACFCITSVLILATSSRSAPTEQEFPASNAEQNAGIRRLLSFQTPFSLFPPSAIISLTDDNTTSFLARPAAFGPLLPAKGLAGQLWIGSGFGDDSLRQGTVTAGAEGELGCSDVPGWVGGLAKIGAEGGDASSAANTGKSQHQKRASGGSLSNDRSADADHRQVSNSLDGARPSVDDGTDDYLHHPLPGSPFDLAKPGQDGHDGALEGKNSHHADIQSIQEGAEIAGKVVILSRGGCGFLEKVKWVQRRGGIALIVGDDTRGGPLIQMYARGDTSNVTIPSVFTSHTTAHLLSSLIPPGSFIEDIIDENGKVSSKVQQSHNSPKKGGKAKNVGSQTTFTPTPDLPKATSLAKQVTKSGKKNPSAQDFQPAVKKHTSWLEAIFGRPQSGSSGSESSRPPSSGRLDWVLVNDWEDEEDKGSSQQNKQNHNEQKKSTPTSKANSKSSQNDDFVIGVQDWRDPDLVGNSKDNLKDAGKKGKNVGKTVTTKTPVASPKTPSSGKKPAGDSLEGGSITPGSGEYGSVTTISEGKSQLNKGDADNPSENSASSGILAKIFGEDDEDEVNIHSSKSSSTTSTQKTYGDIFEGGAENGHEGLWVTLTPASGSSPFFDTLLVLVVSPLVTLTVVYALLLLRSRIRRRRWRAPKSVVERLPVRTFQTRVSSASSSPRLPSSPETSSPTTPLLQASPSRPRPRSRTTSGAPADLVSSPSDPRRVPPRPLGAPEHEKGASVGSQWSKFMGKQVECVVCLEEYVDGVSRVMSLPCGHEFHEACM